MSSPAQQSEPLVIKPPEAARRIGVSLHTLRKLVDAGEIPRVVIGTGLKKKRTAFDPADIELFIRNRKELGMPPCQSSKGRAKRSTATTSSYKVIDLREAAKQLAAKKPKK